MASTDLSVTTSTSLISSNLMLLSGSTSSPPAGPQITWKTVLDKIPLLSDDYYDFLMQKFNLKTSTKSCCKFLSRHLSQDILDAFKIVKEEAVKNGIFPKSFMKIGFLAIVKKSNSLFPPAVSKKFEEVAGLLFARSRYSNDTFVKVFGTSLLPLISLKDRRLSMRCFLHAHVCQSPSDPFDLSRAHLPLNITCLRWQSGIFASTASSLRKSLSVEIQKCTTCIKKCEKLSKGRMYSYIPSDPALANMVDASSLFFNIISIDLFSEVEVLPHSRARSKSTYQVGILISVDYLSGNLSLTILDGSKGPDVLLGLKRLFLKTTVPKMIISDHGSQIHTLKNELENMQVELISLPAGHQFKNRVERCVGQTKRILKSLRQDPSKSFLHQPQSLLDLQGKLDMVEVAMNSRPLFVTTKAEHQTVITPYGLLRPHTSASELGRIMKEILGDIFVPATLGSLVGTEAKGIRNNLRLKLLEFLQSSSMRFLTPVEGHLQCQSDIEKVLLPKQDDIVLYKHSTGDTRMGLILSVSDNLLICQIRTLHNRVQDERPFHTRLLKLLYRPSELDHEGFPKEFGGMDHNNLEDLLPSVLENIGKPQDPL
jgi:hypothetical protein